MPVSPRSVRVSKSPIPACGMPARERCSTNTTEASPYANVRRARVAKRSAICAREEPSASGISCDYRSASPQSTVPLT